MRALVLPVSLAVLTGCVFSDYAGDHDDDQQALEVALALPDDADTLEFSAYEGGGCDEIGQLAVGGEVIDDIDGRRFVVGMTESMPVRTGTFVFEAIALDTSGGADVELAAGCGTATIRAKQTTTLRLTLVPF